jgi:hypothetical protein
VWVGIGKGVREQGRVQVHVQVHAFEARGNEQAVRSPSSKNRNDGYCSISISNNTACLLAATHLNVVQVWHGHQLSRGTARPLAHHLPAAHARRAAQHGLEEAQQDAAAVQGAVQGWV